MAPTMEDLKDLKAQYSGYGDISFVPKNCNSYIWFYLPSINMNYQELSQEVQDFQTRFEFLLSKIPDDKTIIALTAEVFFNLKSINSSFDLDRCIPFPITKTGLLDDLIES